MTHNEAERVIRDLQFILMRTRSIMRESMAATRGGSQTDDTDEMILEYMYPYLFGPKSALRAVNMTVDALDAGREMEPSTFHNILYMLWMRPDTWTAICVVALGMGRIEPPTPQVKWAGGWAKPTRKAVRG